MIYYFPFLHFPQTVFFLKLNFSFGKMLQTSFKRSASAKWVYYWNLPSSSDTDSFLNSSLKEFNSSFFLRRSEMADAKPSFYAPHYTISNPYIDKQYWHAGNYRLSVRRQSVREDVERRGTSVWRLTWIGLVLLKYDAHNRNKWRSLTTGNRPTLPQCGNESVVYYGLSSLDVKR